MIVKCIKRTSSVTKQETQKSNGLTVGKEYTVLAIGISSKNGISFRLVHDDGQTPALFDIQQFQIVSPQIPRNWTIHLDRYGGLDICPTTWARLGFWEDFFDDKTEAINQFVQEQKIIMSENTQDNIV